MTADDVRLRALKTHISFQSKYLHMNIKRDVTSQIKQICDNQGAGTMAMQVCVPGDGSQAERVEVPSGKHPLRK